jgi:hypothetical protein
VVDVDREWYLRRCGEDELLAGMPSSLEARARALIAVGLLSMDTARSIVDIYGRARALRGFDDDRGHAMPQLPANSLTPPRVSTCRRTFEQPWGSVRVNFVSSNAQQTKISVTIAGSPIGSPRSHRHYQPGGLPTIIITDDRGKRHSTNFSGGGSDDELTGHLSVTPGLRPDTAWIKLFGEKIDLTASPSDVSVTVESLPTDLSLEALAANYLVRLVESGTRWHDGSDEVSVAITTFVECGVLTSGADVIAQALAGEQLLRGGSVQSAVPPERWRSVLSRRGRNDGPIGARVVGVTTPVFDDIRVAVLELRSSESTFEIEFEAGGKLGGPRRSSLGQRMFATSAVDDRHNRYLGHFQHFGTGSDGMYGVIEFAAPLDPQASVLELQIAAETAQALIRIPVTWEGAA